MTEFISQLYMQYLGSCNISEYFRIMMRVFQRNEAAGSLCARVVADAYDKAGKPEIVSDLFRYEFNEKLNEQEWNSECFTVFWRAIWTTSPRPML